MLPRSLLCVSLACVAGLAASVAQDARAGVTIDVVFWDATSPSGITINAGDEGSGGCNGWIEYYPTFDTGYCMDVILTTTYDFVAMGVSVTYDGDNGLALDSMDEWVGVGVSFDKLGAPLKACAPAGGLADNGGLLQSFDCIIPEPNAPPQGAAGTYHIGTITWNTSATTPGTETIQAILASGDGFSAVINGNVIDISYQVVLGSHVLTIIPEPGTAALLGMGFVGLLLAARRRGPQ